MEGSTQRPRLSGLAVAWRPAIADLVHALATTGDLQFTEIVAENVDPARLDPRLTDLLAAGITVVPHGVTLGLAAAQRPDPGRLGRLAQLADRMGAPLVSEHVAFVRAADSADPMHPDVLEAGHLLPPPRTRDSLEVLVENVRIAQEQLPVPLALENIAAVMSWPEDEISEPDFLTALTDRTGIRIVLDVANLYASATARGTDPHAELHRFPLERVAYVHIAGGHVEDTFYLDTHADPVIDPVLDLLRDLVETTGAQRPGVLLERDEALTDLAVRSDLSRIEGVLV